MGGSIEIKNEKTLCNEVVGDISVKSSKLKGIDVNGKIIPTWADILNRANLGFEVMHERNAHNFPLDLASTEATEVALTAPQIG